jgi:branched-chain amino acid transport system permease protein
VFGGAYLTVPVHAALSYIVAQSWDWLHGEAGYVNLGHYIYFGIGRLCLRAGQRERHPGRREFVVAALFTGLMGALELSAVPPARRLLRIRHAALLPLFELLASTSSITRGSDGICAAVPP